MKYQVFEFGIPADCHHRKVHESWNSSTFNTFDEALEYARKWLGPQYGGSYDGKEGIILKPNDPYCYCSYGDTIEIREIPDKPDDS